MARKQKVGPDISKGEFSFDLRKKLNRSKEEVE
jgi:hypothetical protein